MTSGRLDYSVIVCDLFNAHEPDHETVVGGFAAAAAAVEYARRRMRSSLEEARWAGGTPEDIRSRWRTFGEDCRVVGPQGVLYLASSEIDTFMDRPASSEEVDWLSLQP